MKHLKTLCQLDVGDIEEILSISEQLKTGFQNGDRPQLLAGRVLSLVFEKPSLRTRNSFEAAMTHLGGGSTFLSAEDASLRGRESLPDIARVLSGYSDAVVMRTFSQKLIDDFAEHSSCPVINGLSDERHPCQALTDLFTIKEIFGKLEGVRLVYLGDGNNIAASLCVAASLTQMSVTICAPPDYQLDDGFLAAIKQKQPSTNITQLSDPVEAVREADVVYTDVWASMGQEAEADKRKLDFAEFQVNAVLMAHAPNDCRFMHDLPARRGLEVTDEVIDGPQSIAFQQAENRMHLAKGLLLWLINVNP